jgi:hypothetical protein
MPFESMGVMTMKMINSTSITSTMGVTLISETGGAAVCFFMIFYSIPGIRSDPHLQTAPPKFNSQMSGLLLSRTLRPLEE